jgi:hypothetical protein
LKILKSLALESFLELKKWNGLVLSAVALFVFIKVIVIVAEKRNSNNLIGYFSFTIFVPILPIKTKKTKNDRRFHASASGCFAPYFGEFVIKHRV